MERWNGGKGQGGVQPGLALGVPLGQRVRDPLAQTQLCGAGLALLVTKPFGGSRRGAQHRLPHTFPLPIHPKPLLPTCPSRESRDCALRGHFCNVTPGRRTDPSSRRGSRRVCRRSWCSRRNTPQQIEPQEVPAQVWAPWATEHPMGSTGSSEEPGLSWVLLKRELWGGGQPLSRSYHKHSTSQRLNTSQPPPASEHPGDRATVLGTGVWGTAGSFPVPVPQRLPSARLVPLCHTSEPCPISDSRLWGNGICPPAFGFTPGDGQE